jgi:predicted Zn-dependent protease with MMP-like domain
VEVDRASFERLVERAMDEVPPPFDAALDEVAVIVEERSPRGRPPLYGLYHGVPYGRDRTGSLPPRISVYMHPMARDCPGEEDLVRQIRITVLHELGHHLGLDEERLDDLGYG